MDLLYTLLIFVLIAGLVYWLITILPFPQPFKNIALAILGVIALIYLLGILFGVGSFPRVVIR